MNFGEKVKTLRKGAHMSQAELARELGVSTRTVQSYEKGQSYPKQRSIYAKMSSIFGVEQNYLLTETEAFVSTGISEKYWIGSEDSKRRQKETKETGVRPLSPFADEDLDALMYAVQKAYVEAKEANKKFTPKKYLNTGRKND